MQVKLDRWLPRLEDIRLIQGKGRYTDDLAPNGTVVDQGGPGVPGNVQRVIVRLGMSRPRLSVTLPPLIVI